ncbi:MAG: precorrin-6y C5,15-methyltransferase (decarboxylating) subunit CbiE [Rhodospirillales bacterium]|nr:precorrin-6y C5,15-methyltransferase (decarboxylating) subunit CbiE [Rhodospirillales bacterium]
MKRTTWLAVVGLGEDGLEGLSPYAHFLIETADVLVGGERHLSKVSGGSQEQLAWGKNFDATLDEIETRRGKNVTILASGNPMYFGAGSVIARRFGPKEITVIPVPGAFSLAASRMGWSLPDAKTVTIHGRPLESLNLYLAPGQNLLILSRDGGSPQEVAALLTEKGFGQSRITVFEHMGGAEEKRIEGVAESWSYPRCADLNSIAVECIAGPTARPLTRLAGLPDDVFEHDGQLTKREVRAVTLAALAPLPHQTLWDLGAGAGSIAIEWLRSERWTRAVAVEQDSGRVALIARNAANLGVPGLKVVEGDIISVLDELGPAPDAIFVGGGVSDPGLLEACWAKLSFRGRLVVNAVTVEGEHRLLDFQSKHGGELTRISVERAEPVGKLSGFKPHRPVIQYACVKTESC